MNTQFQEIVNKLPYKRPFLFVDEIEKMDENGAVGSYTLRNDEFFYEGHFPGQPITPGVIVIEIMAQIGLVCLGIFLGESKSKNSDNFVPLFSSANTEFLRPVLPGDKLVVESKKIYYRFGKLKCEIVSRNFISGEIVCKGEFSGMIVNRDQIENK